MLIAFLIEIYFIFYKVCSYSITTFGFCENL